MLAVIDTLGSNPRTRNGRLVWRDLICEVAVWIGVSVNVGG